MMKSLASGLAAFLLGLIMTLESCAFEPADANEIVLYNSRLIPAPRSVQYGRGVVVFNAKLRCVLLLPDDWPQQDEFNAELKELCLEARRDFGADFQFEIKSVKQFSREFSESKEKSSGEVEFAQKLTDDHEFFKQTNAYRCLAVGDKRIPDDAKPEEFVERQDKLTGTLLITASDLAGFRDSFKTLKQLAETFGVSATTEDSRRFIPELEIDDVPRLVFRGLHLCWFPETESTSIERSIRMASYYKFNYIVLEFWGVFPFEACDAMCWEEFHTSKDEVRRLVSLGRSLGVQLIPQINLLGHAPGARGASGKHTLLDNHPEMEPLFEPDGWTWNIYNPSTRDLLSKCVLELYETFDRPPYFHIGCDEAYSAGTSFVARRKGNYAEVLAEWITHFHDLLQERDCRIMMWHDMLIEPADFKGYTACGNAKTWGLIDKLPKDILLCDWQYDKPKENETWPTTSFFSEKGFEVLSCPWRNLEGIKSLAGNAAEKKYFGLLCTTWHTFYGVEMRNIFTVGAHSAWGTEYRGDDQLSAFNRHLRQANRDTVNKNYRTEGVNDWQVLKETYVPF